MITHMRLQNFKSWVDTGDVRLAPLTGFFGANSSGKSSLLQMLLLLKQTTESTDRKLVFRTGGGGDSLIDLGTIPDIIHQGSDRLELSLSWQLPDALSIPIPRSEDTLQLDMLNFTTVIHGSKEGSYVERFTYRGQEFEASLTRATSNGSENANDDTDLLEESTVEPRSTDAYNIEVSVSGRKPTRAQARPAKYMRPIKSYGFPQEAVRYFQNTDYLNDVVLEFEKLFQRVYYLGPLREYPQRGYYWAGEQPEDVGQKGELAVPALLAKGREGVYKKRGKGQVSLETRIAKWLNEMEMVESFRTVPVRRGGTQYELRVRHTPKSAEVLITDVGFGVSQVLPVLVLCYYVPEGSTVILEQPEIHLHPSVQSSLADVFIDAILKRNIQVIVESHSEHFLRRLQRRIAENWISADKTALYFCEMANGLSKIDPLAVDESGNIRNWPKDFFGDLTGDLLHMAEKGFERQLSEQ